MRWENPANDNDGSAPMLVQQHRITMPPAAAFKPSTDLLVRVESEYNAGTAAARPTKGAGRPGNDELPSWIAAPSVDVRGQQTPPGVCPPRPLPSVDIRGQQTPARVCPPRPLDERPSVDVRGCQTRMTSAPPRSLDNGTPPVPQEATTYGQGHHAGLPFPSLRAHIGMRNAQPEGGRGGTQISWALNASRGIRRCRSQEHRTSGMSGLLQFAQATIELMGRDATFPAHAARKNTKSPCRKSQGPGSGKNTKSTCRKCQGPGSGPFPSLPKGGISSAVGGVCRANDYFGGELLRVANVEDGRNKWSLSENEEIGTRRG